MKFIITKALINGEWIETENNFSVFNPSTQKLIAKVSSCAEKETQAAIESAHAASKTWAKTNNYQRAKILRKVGDLLRQNISDLAFLLTSEQGKPIIEASAEINYAADYFEWFSEEAKRICGEIIPPSGENKEILVYKEPVGICAGITPWNFPMAMLARKIAPALAAGCTFIAKPDEHTPLSALALGQLCQEAGLPDGVLNILPGEPLPISKTLLASNLVRKISFTGSTEVGKLLMRESAQTLKRLTLELGGNAPFIILENADLDLAVQAIMRAKFRNAGQTCICVNRILVHKDLCPQVIKMLKTACEKLNVGDGLEQKTHLGPIINKAAKNRICKVVAESLKQGAQLIHGSLDQDQTNFLKPIILDQVTQKMEIAQQEIFGPVISIIAFSNDQEAIEIANSSEYGLAAYVFSQDLARAQKIAKALEYGMVGVNEIGISASEAPFGGIKQSGFGREGSKYGINEYLQLKYICQYTK